MNLHTWVLFENIYIFQKQKIYISISISRDARVLWLKGDKEIESNSSSYRLVSKKTSGNNEGWYACKVSNNFATVFQKAFLNIKGKILA